MLQVRGLQKRYGALQAVKDATFEIAKGERFGLLGPNGAGKTTTISMITGTLDADAGQVTIDGEPVSTSANRSKSKIGYVPQELAVYDEIDARANLQFFGALYGLSGEKLQSAIDRSLEIAGLSDRSREPVKGFSGGMKRRLNIAVALLHDPQFLVFDEPTVGVDPQSRNAIFETLLALAAEGKTILYTTHYMEEVERLCQRVAVMDHGEVVAQGGLTELHRLLPKSERVTLTLEDVVHVTPWTTARNLHQEGKTLSFEAEDLMTSLREALEAVQAAGGRLIAVRTEAPTLEEVFLHLTGRRLRD